MSTDSPSTHDAAAGPSDQKPRLRFPKEARLFRASEFAKVKTEGRAVHGKFMLLGVLKRQGNEPARLGVVTSRRVGSAVERNAARRRLREIFRLARPQIAPGTWMVVIAKRAAVGVASAQLREEWMHLARKAGCFRG